MTADLTTVERALDAIDPDEVVSLLRSAIAIPSVTLDESPIADFAESELRASGVKDVTQFEFAPGRNSLWATLSGAGRGPSAMLLGHTDTVHAEGWADAWRGTEAENPFAGAIIEDHIVGRGAGDQKAGIVSIIAAQRAINRAGINLRGDVVTVLVGDEESGQPDSGRSAGVVEAVRRIKGGEIPRGDFAIYTEPTKLDVYTAQLGFIIAEITVRGESAFWSTPWLGRDALRTAYRLLERLWTYHNEVWNSRDHPLIGRPSFLVTEFRAGGQIAVPEEAYIQFIRKLVPGETLEEVSSELEGLLRNAALADGIESDITYTNGRANPWGGQPAETDSSHDAVRLLSRIASEVTGQQDNLKGADYWSELQVLSDECGIPGVYFSSGDISNCHTVNEKVAIDQLIDGVRILTRFLIEYCGVVND